MSKLSHKTMVLLKNGRVALGYLIAVLFAFNLQAAEIKFSGSGPKQVAVGDQFQVTWSVNTNGSGFVPPALNEFDVLSGPNQSSSISIINGSMTESLGFSMILRAKKEGTITIKPAKVKVNGVEIESNSFTITVVKADPAAQQRQQRQRQQIFDPFDPFGEFEEEPPAQSNEKVKANGEDIFVRVNLDKTKVFQGEPIIATLKIYTRVDLAGFKDIRFPAFTGFWSEDIQNNTNIELKTEVLDGVQYNVGTFKQMVLTAQKAGTITIDPLEVDAVVRQRVQRRSRSIFDNFFGGVQNVEVALKSQARKVEVLPWPSGKPSNFIDIAGKIKVTATVDKTKAKANDAVNLKLTFSGNGNLKLLEAPTIEFPPDIEAYDPKISDKINVNQGGISGSRTFEYLLIPRAAGEFKLGPFAFSYFDTERKSYQTIEQPEITLIIEKSDGQTDPVSVGGGSVSKSELKIIGKDIRHIKTEVPAFSKRGEFFFGSWLHIGILVCLALIMVTLYLVVLYVKRKNSDIAYVKNSRATKLAKKRLAVADKLLKQNQTDKFYEELARALWGYAGDKLLIEIAELTKDNVRDKLMANGTSEQVANEFLAVLNDAEFARYAPSAPGFSPQEMLRKSIDIIVKLEEEK